MTVFPNFFRHNTQKEATLEVHQFWPLVRLNCSAELSFFLCSLYAPVCTVLDSPPPPCRSLCSRVRRGCEPTLLEFGLTWPESMACEKFPYLGDGVCIEASGLAVTAQPPLPKTSNVKGEYLFLFHWSGTKDCGSFTREFPFGKSVFHLKLAPRRTRSFCLRRKRWWNWDNNNDDDDDVDDKIGNVGWNINFLWGSFSRQNMTSFSDVSLTFSSRTS